MSDVPPSGQRRRSKRRQRKRWRWLRKLRPSPSSWVPIMLIVLLGLVVAAIKLFKW